MLFPSATVAAALVLVLNPAGTSSIATRTVTPARAAPGSVTSSPSTKVASGLWAPPKKTKRPARESEGEAQEEELLRPQRAPAGGAAAAKKRRPIKMDGNADDGGDDEADQGGDDDDEDNPKVSKKRKRVSEEEEDESSEPLESEPSVIPRLINFLAAPAVVRRSFGFNETSLQGDAGFRMGYQLSIESFPLVTQPNGWYRTAGIGISYEKEYGNAIHNASSGMFNGYPFTQSRLGIDVRFAIPAGDSVIIMPAIGYGRVGADLQRSNPTTPTSCTVASAMDPCFGDVNASYLSVDVHVRVALTPTFALSLAGGYLQGLGVQRGADQITAEGAATMKGFHVEAGASVLLADWVAFQALLPFRRYAFAFEPASGTSFSYRGAGDTYYGLIAGLALFTK